MHNFTKKLVADRAGATAIEYGLIAAFISLGMVASLPSIKESIGTKFTAVSTELAK